MNGLVERIRRELADAANSERATQQRAYMKSSTPFRGVTLPEVRRLTKAALRDEPIGSQDALIAAVTTLWDDAGYREERYAALTVLQLPKHRRWHDPTLLPLYEHLIVTGRWWDVVDDVSTHALRELLIEHPAVVAPVVRTWAHHDDLWRRRAALVCQVGAKRATDPALLSQIITSALTPPDSVSGDFFVRKGIGWALRDYARIDPVWVLAFVEEHRSTLSPLSISEATKHLDAARATGE
ncbi:MAG: DNA alkylation repair protein [Actinomycetes bacterium]